jgi:hypothetical protein
MRPFLSILVPAKSTLNPFRNRNYVTVHRVITPVMLTGTL